jgi:hypothetical protein
MITPSYGLTATERVLPSFTLDWTTGLVQSTVDVTRAGVATFVGSNGLIQSASADTQRIDYSTGVAGLLVEESRTNLQTYSEDFANAAWTKTRTSITANAIVAPDGTLTGGKLVEDATADNTHFMSSASFSKTAQFYTFTIYIEQAESRYLDIGFSGTANWNGIPQVKFDLLLGAVQNFGASTIAKIENAGNGWYRCSITSESINTVASSISIAANNNSVNRFPSYTGDGTSGVFIWGAQLEAGALPTSYIPTEASAVTRNADVATVSGTNFSDWFTELGTVYAEAEVTTGQATSTYGVWGFRPNSAGLGYTLVHRASDARYIRRDAGGSNSLFVAYSGVLKAAATIDPSGAAISVNASALASNTTAISNDPMQQLSLGSQTIFGSNNLSYLNGHLRKFAFYPQILTNAEIQAFSK